MRGRNAFFNPGTSGARSSDLEGGVTNSNLRKWGNIPDSQDTHFPWFQKRRPIKQTNSMIIFVFFQLSSDRGESSLVNVSETDSGALDLSSGSRDRENMKSRSSVASHISHHRSVNLLVQNFTNRWRYLKNSWILILVCFQNLLVSHQREISRVKKVYKTTFWTHCGTWWLINASN